MRDINPPPRKVFTSIILYLTTAVITFVLMVVALVIWIADLLGSGSYAALVVGSFFLLVAIIIYVAHARKSIEYIRDRLDTIYDVAYAARRGYRMTVNIISSLFSDFFSH